MTDNNSGGLEKRGQVCTENLIRVDDVTETPNISGRRIP
jgi:hypothetical protein